MQVKPRLGLIAYEYPPLIGGMATYACAVAQHMHEAGYEVHVFANNKASESHDTIHVHPILTTDLARDLPRLSRFEMDLWHSTNFGYAPLACVKRPFVLTVHGTDFLTPWVRWKMDHIPGMWRLSDHLALPRMRRWLGSPPLRCVDDVLTCSQFSAKLFREEYSTVGRLTVLPNGVDAFYTNSAAMQRVARHPRRMLTVCNLGTANLRKNIDSCLRALARVGDRLDLQYWIVGDGEGRENLEVLAKELGVTHRVSFKGRVSRETLREAYASSSLFVLVPRPQPGDVEGFGIVYLEAAACGAPSLAGRHSGAVDAIAEGQSGFFAEDASPQAIADALESYFTGEVRFETDQVRAHAEKFAWSTVLQRVENVYARHLNRQPIRLPATEADANDKIKTPPLRAVPARQDTDWSRWIRQSVSPSLTHESAAKRVLLITYAFPPVGGPAVQRPAKLVKYLSEFGWDVEVLTAAHDRFPWIDETLLQDVPEQTPIHRVAGWEPASIARRLAQKLSKLANLCGMDAQNPAGTDTRLIEGTDAPIDGTDSTCGMETDVLSAAGTEARNDMGTETRKLQFTGSNPGGRQGSRPLRWVEDGMYWRMSALTTRLGKGQGESLWIKPATAWALRRHRQQPFDAVISTGPPQFVHHVARHLSRATDIPWLADIRDPLVSDFERTQPSQQHQQTMARLERSVLRHADAIVTTCPALANDLKHRYPQRHENSIVSITNGFDRDDLSDWAETYQAPPAPKDEFTFVAAGAFYGAREIRRIIDPLKRVLKKRPMWRGQVKLVLAGTIDRQQRESWRNRLPKWVMLTGYLDHASTVDLIIQSDCSIVVVPECQHGLLSVPGKTFELLALPTHVLALVPRESDTANIVNEAGNATVSPMEDEAQTARVMEKMIDRTLRGESTESRAWHIVDRYNRRELAGKFADVLNQIHNRTHANPASEKKHSAPTSKREVGVA